ncbi:hypothetical protein Nepgr_016429 [Nepenthes gracilis]|uniref:Uncharacterized protein n=1 Tax=Nepenthes gracilis TaxID=150966 RepID=A0AAD3SNI8_NEPGR|nr:hypothetical protein Nepgr_016429 [Nepenthes gracilis]
MSPVPDSEPGNSNAVGMGLHKGMQLGVVNLECSSQGTVGVSPLPPADAPETIQAPPFDSPCGVQSLPLPVPPECKLNLPTMDFQVSRPQLQHVDQTCSLGGFPAVVVDSNSSFSNSNGPNESHLEGPGCNAVRLCPIDLANYSLFWHCCHVVYCFMKLWMALSLVFWVSLRDGLLWYHFLMAEGESWSDQRLARAAFVGSFWWPTLSCCYCWRRFTASKQWIGERVLAVISPDYVFGECLMVLGKSPMQTKQLLMRFFADLDLAGCILQLFCSMVENMHGRAADMDKATGGAADCASAACRCELCFPEMLEALLGMGNIRPLAGIVVCSTGLMYNALWDAANFLASPEVGGLPCERLLVPTLVEGKIWSYLFHFHLVGLGCEFCTGGLLTSGGVLVLLIGLDADLVKLLPFPGAELGVVSGLNGEAMCFLAAVFQNFLLVNQPSALPWVDAFEVPLDCSRIRLLEEFEVDGGDAMLSIDWLGIC